MWISFKHALVLFVLVEKTPKKARCNVKYTSFLLDFLYKVFINGSLLVLRDQHNSAFLCCKYEENIRQLFSL